MVDASYPPPPPVIPLLPPPTLHPHRRILPSLPRGGGGTSDSDDGYGYDSYDADSPNDDVDEYTRRPTPSRSGGAKKSAAAEAAWRTASVARGALSAATSGAGSVSKSMVLGLGSPRHVTLDDIASCPRSRSRSGGAMTAWRLDQLVGPMPAGPFTPCAANVLFDPDGRTVITKYDGRIIRSNYKFVEHSWPRYCQIEFDAPAFQGPDDPEPVYMTYKGKFVRKILRPSVIKIKGTIYECDGGPGGRGKLGKMFRRQVCVGTFEARKRISLPGDSLPDHGGDDDDYDDDDDEYSDDYDDDGNDEDEEDEKESSEGEETDYDDDVDGEE